jgi:hypothetical protein
MAGRGPSPKPAGQRRSRHAPQRGEWVDLEPLARPVLPAAEKDWPDHVRALWEAWRSDPVTSQYGKADIAAVVELGRQYDDLAPNEQRLRMDGLGLTPKGKRDLRWRTPAEVATLENRHLAVVTELKATRGR